MIERYSRTIPASGAIELATGNYFLLLTASAAVNVRAVRQGTNEGFDNVTGGVIIRRILPWENLRILGPAGTTCEYIVGTDNITEDDTDVRLQVASVTGTVLVTESPASAFSETVFVTIADGGTNDRASNASRRRITVCNRSTSAVPVFIRSTGGTTAAGIELQPGQFVELRGTYAFRVLNVAGSGGSADVSYFEES